VQRESRSLGIARGSNARSGGREIVGGMLKLNLRSRQEPISAWFSEWHSHTASIRNPNLSDRSVKLHVGMTADDQRNVEPCKDCEEVIFRCKAGK
jgi:hypothetical protein